MPVKPPYFSTAFGERVRHVRTRQGILQRELAVSAELSVSFLSDVENGKRQVSLVNALKLADALRMTLWQLLPARCKYR